MFARTVRWLALILLSLALPFGAALAQGNTTGKVVTTCGVVSPPFNAGNPGPFTVDASGRLCINLILGPGAGVTAGSTSALASNLVVKNSAGSLYGFEVSADPTLSGAAWWIMVFDATSLPANGAVTPKKCYAIASGSTLAAFAWPTPITFSTGIVIGVSTTGCFTLTASVHAFISGDYQ